MRKNILFLGYWGLGDGLTQATLMPHIRLLLQSEMVGKLVLTTIERGEHPSKTDTLPLDERLVYRPLVSKNYRPGLLNKINDFVYFPRMLRKWIKENDIDLVIGRGSPSGALLYKICAELKKPLYVESFEPHSSYMIESGVWRSWDPRAVFQKKWEQKLKFEATGLMPVSENYRNALIREGVPPQKIVTVPCNVNFNQFHFDPEARASRRQELGIRDEDKVGVYAGKFGGIYYDTETFYLFSKIAAAQRSVFIILTPDAEEGVWHKIRTQGLDPGLFRIRSVPHHEVSEYLSAADYGLATVKPAPSKLYCSVTKVGEYWACGLPVIITDNIGDDSQIVKTEAGGWVLPSNWMEKDPAYFEAMMKKIVQMNDRSKLRGLAEKYRSFNQSTSAYQHFGLV